MNAVAEPTSVDDSLSNRDLAVLRGLPALVLREGYIDNLLLYGVGHVSFDAVRKDLAALPPGLRMLTSLFFLNGEESPDEVARVFASHEVQALLRLGILLEKAGRLHTDGLILLPVLGHVMFVPRPIADPTVYFGEDSVALAVRLSPRRGSRCLDLCSGPGIQALRSAAAGGQVVAVEINTVAAACNELNIALNSLDRQIELRRGDLYAVLRPGERFDFVSANPPLLPFVPDLPYPFVGHGGADGMRVTWRILDQLPEVLADGGTAQVIGTCTGDDAGPHSRIELERYASAHGLQVVMTVPARGKLALGSRSFEWLAESCANATGLALDMVKQRFASHLAALGADQLYAYYLTVTKGSPRPGFVMTQQFRQPGGGFWFR